MSAQGSSCFVCARLLCRSSRLRTGSGKGESAKSGSAGAGASKEKERERERAREHEHKDEGERLTDEMQALLGEGDSTGDDFVQVAAPASAGSAAAPRVGAGAGASAGAGAAAAPSAQTGEGSLASRRFALAHERLLLPSSQARWQERRFDHDRQRQ
jgi:hypothetical protein